MIAYHIDRNNSLHEGQILDLYPCSNSEGEHQLELLGLSLISHFAKNEVSYIDKQPSRMPIHINDINSFIIDRYCEIVRATYYPNYISRFQCIFASETLVDLKLWCNYFKIDKATNIFEIEYNPQTALKFDAKLLRGGIGSNGIEQIINNQSAAFNYWSGNFSKNPLPELLIPLPTKVLKKIDSNCI